MARAKGVTTTRPVFLRIALIDLAATTSGLVHMTPLKYLNLLNFPGISWSTIGV